MIKKYLIGLVNWFSSTDKPAKELHKKRVVFAKEVVEVIGNHAPKSITTAREFSLDDPFVNLFVTIEWEKDSIAVAGVGIKNVKWAWIADGELKQNVEACFDFYDSPLYLLGNIRTEALGVGKHTVKLYIEEELFLEEEFGINGEEVGYIT